MLVRQPISPLMRAVLGMLSIGLLIATYTVLAESRQNAKRQDAARRLVKIQEEIDDLEATAAEANDAKL